MKKKVEGVENIMFYQSPIGQMRVHCKDDFIVKIDFLEGDDIQMIEFPPPTPPRSDGWGKHQKPDTTLSDCISQLDSYFKGELKEFTIPYRICGTDFQQRVWQALTEIPYGQTISYSELAKRIDHPKAVRAVGGANNRNNLSIVVPCHRVVGKNGSLTGYAGGLWRKKWLIDFERKHS